jgi:hypothetical protein
VGDFVDDMLARYGEFDDHEFNEHQEQRCRYCGERGFWWKATGNGWRLEDGDGVIHSCPKRHPPASVDEFEDVSE